MTHDDAELASTLAKIDYCSKINLPEYLREVSIAYWGDWDDEIQKLLSAVLTNSLLYSGSEIEVGSEGHESYFLCATVDDDDLPWDRTQTDW